MSLTVKDILEKTFKKSFKGYDEDEVDKFLDQIIDEIKALQNEYASLKEAFDAEKGKAKKVKDTEETIMHTLVTAQKSAERILGEAARKSETIIGSAEATAKRREEQTTRELAQMQSKLDEIKKSANIFAKNFINTINTQAESFEKTYRGYFGEIEGGLSTQALEKIDEEIAQSFKDMPKTGINEPGKDTETAEEPDMGTFDEPVMISEKLMEMNEINKALSELEEGGTDILQDSYEDKERQGGEELNPDEFRQKYDDYSWLYGNETSDEDNGVGIKDPKGKEELESLIKEIID